MLTSAVSRVGSVGTAAPTQEWTNNSAAVSRGGRVGRSLLHSHGLCWQKRAFAQSGFHQIPEFKCLLSADPFFFGLQSMIRVPLLSPLLTGMIWLVLTFKNKDIMLTAFSWVNLVFRHFHQCLITLSTWGCPEGGTLNRLWFFQWSLRL